MTDTLTLTRAEVASVMDYIFMHSRGNPEGRAWKVYQKMLEFYRWEVEIETEPTLFEMEAIDG